MTEVSLSPVGSSVAELGSVPHAQLIHLGRSAGGGAAVSPQPVRPVRDAAAALGGAAAALAVSLASGLPLGLVTGALLVLVWPLLLAAHGCFAARPLGEAVTTRLLRVLKAGATLGLLSWAAAALLAGHASPAVMLPATAAVTASGLVLQAGTGRHRHSRVVIAGAAASVDALAVELRRSGSEVVAACVPHGAVVDGGFPVRAGIECAVAQASRHGADAIVVIPGPEVTPAVVRRLQWQASALDVGLYVDTPLLDVSSSRTSVSGGAGPTLVHVRPSPLSGPRVLLKTVVERSSATLALLLLAPVLAAVAVLVKRDSAGPAIFRQQRVGRNGTPFTMYKFRTMSFHAEDERTRLLERDEGAGVLFKIRADPRVTRVGRVLRRYSVDELPQLWNVVTGQMSLVGPRPALPEEVALYDGDTRRRLAVQPGLTGLWQVSGRSDLSWEESVRLDLRYVDNWSIGLDVAIVSRTVRAVLDHRGAY